MNNFVSQLGLLILTQSFISLRVVHEHKQIVRNLMSFYGNSSAMQFEYNIGVGGPKSFRGYAAKLDDKWVDNFRPPV